MPNHSDAERIADAYMQHMSAGDLESVVALYAENASLEDPVGTEILHGLDAIRTFYRNALGAKIVLTRTGAVRFAADEMVFPFRCSVSTENGKMVIDIIDHFQLNETGKITAMRAFWGDANTRMEA